MPAFARLTAWLTRPVAPCRRPRTALRMECLEGRDVPALVSVGSIGVGNNPFDVALADFNGDGTQDLVSVNGGTLGLLPGTLSVVPGAGTGTFGTGLTLGVGVGPAAVTVGDYNGDG